MPASLNKALIIGNLTRDPELRYIPSGQAVTSFTVAVNRNYTDQGGGKKEETTFLRIVTWGKRAEVCNEYLRKGSSVFVEGRLQARSWQAQDGSKRTTIELVAQNVQFLSKTGAGADKAAMGGGMPQQGDDMIIDDSFSAVGNNDIGYTPNELGPDEKVPF